MPKTNDAALAAFMAPQGREIDAALDPVRAASADISSRYVSRGYVIAFTRPRRAPEKDQRGPVP